ncbi:PDZ domain-containing protein MAGIX, partial [Galemys pyrenaicus]
RSGGRGDRRGADLSCGDIEGARGPSRCCGGKTLESVVLRASPRPPATFTARSEVSGNVAFKHPRPGIRWGPWGPTHGQTHHGLGLRDRTEVTSGTVEGVFGLSRDVEEGHGWVLARRGRGLSLPAGRSARQLLERLDARPLASRAANDVAALVRRAGATLRLRPKEATCMLDSAEIEVTDSRLPNPTLVEHPPQLRQSNTLGTCTTRPQMTQVKVRCASKHPQGSDQFCVELDRSPVGFGLTFRGGRDATGNTPLAVGGLLKDGPAQRCGRLQAGDLVLRINGESTQGLSHAQVLERIRAGSPRLHLVLHRPVETHPSKPEVVPGPQKGDDRPGPGRPEVLSSSSASASPFQHAGSCEPPQTRGSQKPSPERAADDPAVSPAERRTEEPGDRTPGSPGPWLVPSEERLSRALGIPGSAQLSLEMAAGRRRH